MPSAWFSWRFKQHPVAFLFVGPLAFMIAFGVMTLLVAAYDYHIVN